ncbi:hypothetical protein C7T94_07350 [Pedobacter yulinensis]|uniref:Uncharacterized protein n=1 Tax=Pedobacter yulinensis TaxID=2126353 RepID=A0A2T3HJ58_9SPHI|nr:hypothetical protein [Pedobacter yulinensis]PST82486.1 hypothetical protein C7T94_07350 [Pedobacter yulinensis]
MQEFDQLKALWQGHEVEVKLTADEMLRQAKKEVNSLKTRSVMNIAGMLASVVIIALIPAFYDFQSWTSYAGVGITIFTILIFTVILFNDYRLISRSNYTQHPNRFLDTLKVYQLNRFRLYNSLYWFYTVALSVGIVFYLYEILDYFPLVMQAALILVTLGWMVFCSTILRKAVIRRERERIGLLIEKFERISEQFNEK